MESPNLISLDEFNRRRTVIDAATKLPQPNGIACPQCGKEMCDTVTGHGITLMSNPPRVFIHCPECGCSTTRVE